MIASLSNFAGIQKEVDIALITLNDNSIHTYCYEISWQKDNSTPIGIAKLKMPYSPQIEKYWTTYYGAVIIHANLNNKAKQTQGQQATKKQLPNKSVVQKHDKDKIRLQNDNYNYSFIGKVHRFKQEGKRFILYLEDLGWKFLQKVPIEFRQTYIAGQTLDNAFQAICEFMGVDFAYSIEALSEYNFSADGYSIEKNGEVIEDVQTIFEGLQSNKNEEDEVEETEDEKMGKRIQGNQPFEASGLIEYENKQKKAGNNNSNTNNNNSNNTNNDEKNKSLNQSVTNQKTNNETPEQQNIEAQNEKIEQYQEEFDKKIEDLFKGNTLYDSNISDSILNYNWISVTPSATQSSNSSSVSGENSGNSSSDSESNDPSKSNNNSSQSSNGASSARNSLQKRDWNGWHGGQYYINGKIHLSDDYIKKLTPSQAWAKYQQGLKTGVYRDGTMNKLLAKSFWQPIK